MSKLGGMAGGLVMDEDGNIRSARTTPDLFDMEGRGTLLPYQKKDGKVSVALPGILAGMANSAQDPGRAMRGEPVSDERALEFGMNLLGGSVGAAGKEAFQQPAPGLMNTFGGKVAIQNLIAAGKRDPSLMDAYKSAVQILKNPAALTPEFMDDFWQRYGVDLGFADRMPRILIDPKATKLDPSTGRITNPEFDAAYPGQLDEVDFLDDAGGNLGVFRQPVHDYDTGVLEKRAEIGVQRQFRTHNEAESTAEHELTHFGDFLEGQARGGSHIAVKMQIPEAWDAALAGGRSRKRLDSILEQHIDSTLKTLPYPKTELGEFNKLLTEEWAGASRRAAQVLEGDTEYIELALSNKLINQNPKLSRSAADTQARVMIADLQTKLAQNPTVVEGVNRLRKHNAAQKLYDKRVHETYQDLTGESSARLSQLLRGLDRDPFAVRPSSVFDNGGTYATDGAEQTSFRFAPRNEQISLVGESATIPKQLAEARVLRGVKQTK